MAEARAAIAVGRFEASIVTATAAAAHPMCARMVTLLPIAFRWQAAVVAKEASTVVTGAKLTGSVVRAVRAAGPPAAAARAGAVAFTALVAEEAVHKAPEARAAREETPGLATPVSGMPGGLGTAVTAATDASTTNMGTAEKGAAAAAAAEATTAVAAAALARVLNAPTSAAAVAAAADRHMQSPRQLMLQTRLARRSRATARLSFPGIVAR
jgi:hypothetical protein